MPTVIADGLRIDYCDEGASTSLPIVCLTGWCSSRERFARFVARAAQERRVLALDWRGHGGSQMPSGDFGIDEMARDVLAVAEDARLDKFAIVSASHSGWVALAVRERLGDRVPKVVHMDWLLVPPSPLYMDVIRRLQSEATWEAARDKLFGIWRGGVDDSEVEAALDVMRAHGPAMWMRAGREIERSFREQASPLAAWAALPSRPEILHMYGQPQDPAYLEQQQELARRHRWFFVEQVRAQSHFTMIETPLEAVEIMNAFLDQPNGRGSR
jgi:pimeloyl-ACP methyl ester carboxylesterase